jgi:renalase
MEGCFTLMLGFQEQLPIHWQAAVVKSSLIGWISINSSKAMRDKGYSMVVQSTNDWAEDNLETNRDDVQQIMRKELSNILNMELKPNHIALQKWRYAKASNVTDADTDFLIDTNLNLAACGDWCIGGRVEAGFLSAYRLAQHMNTLS